ncbi:hypothetical protein OG242_32565 (plasmid) [Streptomyces sp. NBC_00727]|uniref:hypothetical protein n=1 Tax=Streptomyces sp. NBC_00727 TaxID=2903675 RepID=UPI002F90F0B5
MAIGNWQGGNSASMAYVGLWWSKPVSGPVIPDPSKFMGFSPVEVPPHGGRAETAPLTARIPASSGNHICLLAKVWHPLDNVAAGGLADPVNDRHWAQHNLAVLPAAPAAPEPFAFLATNPTDDEVTYQIGVRPMPRELWGNIPNDERLRPVNASAWLSLKDTTTGGEAQGQNELTPHAHAEPDGTARHGTAARRHRRGGQRSLRSRLCRRPAVHCGTGRSGRVPRTAATRAAMLSTEVSAPAVRTASRGTRGTAT